MTEIAMLQTRVAEEQLDKDPVVSPDFAHIDGRSPFEGVNLWPVAAKSTGEEDEEEPEEEPEEEEYDSGIDFDDITGFEPGEADTCPECNDPNCEYPRAS